MSRAMSDGTFNTSSCLVHCTEMYAELHGVPSERAIPAQRRAHGTLPSLHQNPARVKAVGAVDNLDLLEALTSGRFLYDLWLASADLAVAYLVEVVRGAHAFAL
eukprot:2161345-Prymnesium_polylepis.1